MSLQFGLKKILETLGKDNKPSYAVVAIATAKGIFRPIFTMMDKKEKPETKKYAATRECLTEIIAIPTYLTCGYLAGKLGNLFKDPKSVKYATHNLSFVGVCLAALVIIPGLCSITIDPLTKRIFKSNNCVKSHKQNSVLQVNNKIDYSKAFQYWQFKKTSGVRVN